MNNIIGLENINESLSTHYLIYKITNTINGKYYIGQHCTDNIYDNYMGSGDYIIKAENKYGLSCFQKEILFDFDNFDDMNKKEAELVQLSNCFPIDPNSYNLRAGGSTQLTDVAKKKLSISQKLRFANMSDKKRLAFSKTISKVVSGTNNPMYGKNHTLESKNKMSNKNTGTKDKIWIFNKKQKINKCVFISELPEYLTNGWECGRINLKQDKNKISHKGLKWVHNVDLKLETAQTESNITFYLDKGWKFGRLPINLRQQTHNKKEWRWMINKELKMKCRVYNENIEYFKSIGFKFGSRITRLKD